MQNMPNLLSEEQRREEEANDPLLKTKSSNQDVSTSYGYISYFGYLDNFAPIPAFNNAVVDRMLCEPKVNIGLSYLKGAINSDTRYEIEAKNPDVQQFVESQFEAFMARGMIYALKSLDRGFSANEVLYEKLPDGRYSFKELVHIPYQAAHPRVAKGKVTTIEIKPDCLAGEDEDTIRDKKILVDRNNERGKDTINAQKKYWTVHNRDYNVVWGRSHLFGAHIPYHSLCSNGGIWEGINLWFRKNAFDGGELYVPEGYQTIENRKVHYREIGQRMLDLKRTGGTLVMTSATDDKGNPLWKYVPPSSGEAPATLLEWYASLGDQICEGLGVPPDLFKGAEAGAGNNKRVTQSAFYTMCTHISTFVLHDFKDQCVAPTVRLNYGKKLPPEELYFEIKKIKVQNEMDQAQIKSQMGNQKVDENGNPKKENDNPFNKDQNENNGKPQSPNSGNLQNPNNPARKAG